MAIPEKISEAINQTSTKMQTFRKAMLVLLFEWQNLETRLELTEKIFQESYPFEESESSSQKGADFGGVGLAIERRLSEVEEREREFRAFQEKGLSEMEVREERLGFLRREVELRERRVVEKEGVVEMERKGVGEKEKRVEECLRESLCKEEELRERIREIEVKERELQLREKEWKDRDKGGEPMGAAVFRVCSLFTVLYFVAEDFSFFSVCECWFCFAILYCCYLVCSHVS